MTYLFCLCSIQFLMLFTIWNIAADMIISMDALGHNLNALSLVAWVSPSANITAAPFEYECG